MQYVIEIPITGPSRAIVDAMNKGHTIVMAIPMHGKHLVVMERPEPETIEALAHCIEEIEETLKHPSAADDEVLNLHLRQLVLLHRRFGG